MLQRDYLMRLIQLFFEALAKFIRSKEGKDENLIRRELDELYTNFVKYPRDYFTGMSVEDIIATFDDEEKTYKIEIIAELIYQEALLDNANRELLLKSLALFRHVDLISDTFSIDRQRKVGEIESLLTD